VAVATPPAHSNTEDLVFALYDREANELDRRIAAT